MRALANLLSGQLAGLFTMMVWLLVIARHFEMQNAWTITIGIFLSLVTIASFRAGDVYSPFGMCGEERLKH